PLSLHDALPISTPLTFNPMPLYDSNTSWNSFLRSSPLSTKMQCRFDPAAWWINVAATVESTPPDRAITTLSLPSVSFNVCTVLSTNWSGVQSCAQPHICTTKLRSRFLPSVVCVTSG